MIPGNILNKHILLAIDIVDKSTIPRKHKSRKFNLIYKSKLYPPKYIIAMANKFANGEFLDSELFGGGKETNQFLNRLGFIIVNKNTENSVFDNNYLHIERYNHHKINGRCSECKNVIYTMLKRIYGSVKMEHKFDIPVEIQKFKNLYCYAPLLKIYNKLISYRNHRNFVKSKKLTTCDIYVINNDFIVELDEVQHFSIARKITLENYPSKLKLKYKRKKWINLCEELNSKDNSPVFRDEQRAWYDTIRDFLPMIDYNFQPTLRIYLNKEKWCSLNPQLEKDVEKFKQLLGV